VRQRGLLLMAALLQPGNAVRQQALVIASSRQTGD
jgi:hypothetical protein